MTLSISSNANCGVKKISVPRRLFGTAKSRYFIFLFTGIATQGRAHSDEFVQEFRIQYGSNGKDFIDYKEVDGSPKLFLGNEDGDYVVRNDFDQPIIAQWIRINPTRWADRISMRVELYGCEYIPDVLQFNGKSLIKRDLSR